MAKNLLTKRKHTLIVWNRDGAKSEALAAEFPGRVTVAGTAKEVVETAQVRKGTGRCVVTATRGGCR